MTTYYRTTRKRRKHRYGNAASRNYGHERALQHIADAKSFSNEIGGLDNEVKTYFFGLPESEMDKLLYRYGKQHGEKSRKYAKQTMPSWKRGRVTMSGTVARRLFSLLPPMMPLEKKYSMVKSLWKTSCPKTKATFHVGPNVTAKEVTIYIARHLVKNIGDHFIESKFKNEFNWLSQEDVELQEQLHNHFKSLHRDAVVANMKQRFPMLRTHFEQDIVTRMAHTFTVLNHEITIEFSNVISGISDNANDNESYPRKAPVVPTTLLGTANAAPHPVASNHQSAATSSTHWSEWWWAYLLFLLWLFCG